MLRLKIAHSHPSPGVPNQPTTPWTPAQHMNPPCSQLGAQTVAIVRPFTFLQSAFDLKRTQMRSSRQTCNQPHKERRQQFAIRLNEARFFFFFIFVFLRLFINSENYLWIKRTPSWQAETHTHDWLQLTAWTRGWAYSTIVLTIYVALCRQSVEKMNSK